MTDQQKKHLNSIQTKFCERVRSKYTRGQQEHGGNLWDRNNLWELGREITDLVTYFHCVEENYSRIIDLVSALNLAIDPITINDVSLDCRLNLSQTKQLLDQLTKTVTLYDTRARSSSEVSPNDPTPNQAKA